MMQRRRGGLEIFPDLDDLNQGPTFNGLDMTGNDECRFAPTERRVLSNEISGEKSYSSWDVGESSSRPSVQNHAANNNNNNNNNNRSVVIPMDIGLSVEYSGPSSADAAARSSVTSNARVASGLFGNNNQGQSSVNVNTQEPTSQRSNSSSQQSTQELDFNVFPFSLVYGTSAQNARSNVNRVNAQSNSRNENIMIPNLNATTNDEQRSRVMIPNLNVPVSEETLNAPRSWDLFPGFENEHIERRGHTRQLPSRPSSSRNPPRHHQPPLRLEIPDENVHGADIDGRQRWLSEVRQILSVLRRGENVNAEDYMFVDPVMNGVADLHDRHRDMRLDVDNMSYEELLALEERIGDVKTGLTEEVILDSMKQRKHFSFMALVTKDHEPCCICQEEYKHGDDIGTLDCGHVFHVGCIMEWLKQKNVCPICKMPGLSE